MEAKAKLLKKKRVAHMGGKMSKSSFDEPKLPPDDYVYNIMKDMDSNNVVSYRQSQEIVSRKRQDEGERQINSFTRDSSYNKQAKKVLPQKSFPLMKKCQTSLKYLKKNRCIPKPIGKAKIPRREAAIKGIKKRRRRSTEDTRVVCSTEI